MFFYLILILGMFSFFRIIFGLILSNVHQIKEQGEFVFNNDSLKPKVSVVIPAYNEEKFAGRCIESVINNDYSDFEVIVVNDGSTDNTQQIIENKSNLDKRIIPVYQKNSGKATAINNGVKNYCNGSIVMVLDSDSYIERDSISKMVKYFRNRSVVAMASNVKISSYNNILEYVQYIEYLLGHKLKGSEDQLGLQYIIGGVGSCFRKDFMLKAGLYDTDTITEDIDFTLKMIDYFGNNNYKFSFASDVIAYTEPVRTLNDLIKQRYRWKFGRFKSLVKYRNLFFNVNAKYHKMLTFWKLPKVIFEEFFMLIDPIITFAVVFLSVRYLSLATISSIIILFSIYLISSVFSSDANYIKHKLLVIVTCPFAYLFLEVINIVDYISLLLCIKNFKEILFNINKQSSWNHVER